MSIRPFLFAFGFSFAFLGFMALGESPQEKATLLHDQNQQPSEGVVIAVSGPEGRDFGFAGSLGLKGRAPSQDSLFEIGSITKVFTSLLLAETVREGKARFNDPAGLFLLTQEFGPDHPLLDGITLESLATHTSGLPRLPDNLFENSHPANPYAHYDADRLYAYLKKLNKTDLKTTGQYHYSNLGAGLLGHLLELIWDQPLADLMRERIFAPLGMRSTLLSSGREQLGVEEKNHLATGHVGGVEVPYWDLNIMAGAGAALSSARDLLTFGEAHWNRETPEGFRAALTEAVRLRSGSQALGWIREGSVVSHAGGTGGFRSHLWVDLEKKTVRVELLNSAGESFEENRVGNFLSISGFWSGVLETPSARLRLVHYIDDEGRVAGFSLDQGCAWYHAAKTRFENGTIEMSFPSVEGHYSGRLEEGKFVGTWRQTGPFPLVLTREKGIPETLKTLMGKKIIGDLAPFQGYWSGKLGGEHGLFVYLRVSNAGGLWLCDLFSPDQTPVAIDVTAMQVSDTRIKAEWADLDGRFEGQLDLEKKILRGTWKQLGSEQPLELSWSGRPPR